MTEVETATEQLIGIDNSSKPAFLRPINAPLPAIYFKDIIGLKPTIAETKDIRQKRIDALDKKKPLLAIEDEPDNIPTFTAEELNAYKDKTKETRQAEQTTDETINSSLDESLELRAFKDSFKNKYRWNWQMGQLLIDNNIKDPKTGNAFYINPSNKVLVRGTKSAVDKETLKDILLKSFNDKLIKKILI